MAGDLERHDELEAALAKAGADALAADERIAALLHEVEGLQTARANAAVINQAKGVLMSTMHIGADAAFAMLVAASMRENVKLSTIAERIASAQDTGGSDEG